MIKGFQEIPHWLVHGEYGKLLSENLLQSRGNKSCSKRDTAKYRKVVKPLIFPSLVVEPFQCFSESHLRSIPFITTLNHTGFET